LFELNKLYNMDCMEGMKQFPDKYFDLAIVDPPYGLGNKTSQGGCNKNSLVKFKQSMSEKRWDDNVPTDEYFEELFRVSKHQIIWGGNYFGLPKHRTFIVWDKMTYIPTMSQVEMAWTSFNSPARLIQINSNNPDRLHPTQKPVALYKWLLMNYAKQGDKILDTHVGSASSLIACYDMGFEYIGFELDKDYYDMACKRLEEHKAQIRFDL